jgi:hypothetical protein
MGYWDRSGSGVRQTRPARNCYDRSFPPFELVRMCFWHRVSTIFAKSIEIGLGLAYPQNLVGTLERVEQQGADCMDAARIERIFGGGRLASTLLMGAFSLVFSGCGSSGAGASGASVVLPAGAPAPAVHSSLKSAATYGLLVADGEKLIDVPMGTSPAVKTAQQKALAKVSTAPKNLYLRSDGTSSLVQRFRPFLTFPINYAFFKLKGSEEPFEAYVPEGFNLPTHSGVFPQDFQNYSSSQRIDVEWTLPVPGTGLFPDIALANVPQINLGGEIPITVPSTDRVHFVIEQSGGNQAITLDGVGEIYNGPQRFIIPWVSSFSPGLHRLKITVDGQEMANDSYMQRQLMFERPFPNSTDVVAGDVAITNTFGWTTDGATIDASLPLTSEFWTAGGSEQAAQFAPKNFNNQVSFTLNTLRETITKSLQPLIHTNPKLPGQRTGRQQNPGL